MIQHLLGLATLPTLWVVARFLLWLTDSTSSWHECGWCNYKTTTKWDRLKRLQMRRHEDRRHRVAIATMKAELAAALGSGMSDRDATLRALRISREVERKGAL